MDIEDVRTFVTLATTRSFSRSAEELHLTQPAVTRRLQRLETTVGTSLIDRSCRPLRLTQAGVSTLESCRHLLDAFAGLLVSAGAPGRALSEIRFGVAHALTEFALLSPVDHLRHERPDVRLVLATGWSHDLLRRLKAGRLDAAVVLLDAREKLGVGLAGTVLATEHLVPIAPRPSLVRSARRIADYRDSNWILNPEGCAARAALEQAFHRSGTPMRVIVETYTYDLQLALVAQGRGYGLVPARLLAESPYRADVESLSLEFPGQKLRIWMATRSLPPSLESAVATFGAALERGLGARQNGKRHPK
ncbi:MAG TPA: LysR family transcriptional regulator [Polyangiaceae bacterium]|nr:LysR family transcriptional regulator [Polyangiaceae bacterium]